MLPWTVNHCYTNAVDTRTYSTVQLPATFLPVFRKLGVSERAESVDMIGISIVKIRLHERTGTLMPPETVVRLFFGVILTYAFWGSSTR